MTWLVLLLLVAPLAGCSAARGRAAESPRPAPLCGDDRCDEAESLASCPRDCLGVEWVRIEGGAFTMGDDGGRANERPAHRVTLPTFEISRREATDGEYRRCVDADACTEPVIDRRNELVSPEYCTWLNEGREDHPINCIDWHQARAFCEWAGGRLPTEAEWEFAARGRGRDVRYAWGDVRPTCALTIMGVEPYHVGCREERTFPVCSRPRGHTPQGLCDITGSLIEWVEDAAHDSYEGAPSDGSAWVGDGEPEARIARGGSLATRDPSYLTTRARFSFEPDVPRYVTGVRCARDAR